MDNHDRWRATDNRVPIVFPQGGTESNRIESNQGIVVSKTMTSKTYAGAKGSVCSGATCNPLAAGQLCSLALRISICRTLTRPADGKCYRQRVCPFVRSKRQRSPPESGCWFAQIREAASGKRRFNQLALEWRAAHVENFWLQKCNTFLYCNIVYIVILYL